MKKVLFAVICLLVVCGCSNNPLYSEAKDMNGIGLLNIFDTQTQIKEKLNKHNESYKYKFDSYRFIKKAYFGDNLVLWDNTLPRLVDNPRLVDKFGHNLYELSYIIDEDKCIDLDLLFHKDSVYQISSSGDDADFLKSAFIFKYGNGYDRKEMEGGFVEKTKTWENAKIKANYSIVYSGRDTVCRYFSISTKDSLFIKRVFDTQNIDKEQERYNKI